MDRKACLKLALFATFEIFENSYKIKQNINTHQFFEKGLPLSIIFNAF